MAQLDQELTHLLSKAILAAPITYHALNDNNAARDIFVGKLLKQEPWKSLITPLEFHARMYLSVSIATRHAGFVAGIEDEARTVADLADAALVERITRTVKDEFLELLPLHYSAYFELPSFPAFNDDIVLSPTLSLVTRRDDELNLAAHLPAPSTYLCIKVTGLQTFIEGSSASDLAASRFKQFISLAVQGGAIKYVGRPFQIGSTFDAGTDEKMKGSRCFLVSERNTKELSSYYGLGTDFRTYTANLHVNTENLQVFDVPGPGETLLTMPGRQPDTPDEIERGLWARLTRALAVDALPNDDEDARALRTAIEWFFDAEISQNGTVQLIQRFIGIEALLGVADEKQGITEKLAIRYAFLLGKTRRERAQRISDFKKAYDLRSQLVHGRTARLTNVQQEISNDVRTMLVDLIWHEAGEIATPKAASS